MKRGDRLVVIGGNGKGKSTLLKTLVNELPALGGSFEYSFQIEYGSFNQYMAQYTGSKTVLDDFWDEFQTLTQNEA
ncbi:MAG: ATP-binding cassette domain-containing protein [Niameybacter sp.]|nr:ATP-binding cassette domain-containing protein [Niameybacter sp.]